MKVFPFVLVGLVTLVSACGSTEAVPFCNSTQIVCNRASYFALCAPPEENADVDEAGGQFCSYKEAGEPGPGLEYIGEPLDEGSCNGGSLDLCDDGNPPECYYLPNCVIGIPF